MSSPEPREEVEPIDLANSRAAKKQNDEIVKWARQQYDAIRNDRARRELQWKLNLSFFFGRQNVVPIRTGMNTPGVGIVTRLHTPPAPPWRARPIINRIRPIVRTELSQLTGNKPNASVVPSSAEDRDMYAAMAAEQIWSNFYTEKNIKAIMRRAMWWTCTTGNGFTKTWWDFNAGGNKTYEETGLPILDEKTKQPVKEGDIRFISETPFHVLCPDFREEDIEQQPYVIHAQLRSPDYIKINFPEHNLKLNSDHKQDLIDESFMQDMGNDALKKQHSVLVLEVWVKPGVVSQFPDGAVFTVVGDKVVQGWQGLPYAHGQFPFAKFDHIPSGKFYSTSVIEDLIPIQREYNRTRGQIIEAKNRMSKPQLLAARGSIDPHKITSEPGLVIQYTPGFDKPEPLPLQGLPSYVVQELERCLKDMDDISGQHEVTHGQVPPGVTAATAISYLQERDESKLSPTFDSMEEGIEKMAKQTLNHVHSYWDTKRLVKITGPDGSFDVLAFKGSDLRGNLDIRIEAGSALPTSKAAKQAFIMDMMKMGFIEPNDGLEQMDMGGINKIYEKIQVDQRQAQRENLRMSKVTKDTLEKYTEQNMQLLQQDPMAFEGGDPPIIISTNTFDNHLAHIEYHDRYRKGQAFEALPVEAKTLFEAHVQEHRDALMLEMLTQPPVEESTEEGQSTEEQPPGPAPMPEMEGEMQ